MTKTKLPAKIRQVIDASEIKLSTAEAIAANYSPLMMEVKEQETKLKKLKAGTLEHCDLAKRIRIDLSKVNPKVAEQKKEDKANLLTQTRFIDALHNTVKGYCDLTKNDALAIEEHFERIEQKEILELEATRTAEIKAVWPECPEGLGLGKMDANVYAHFLEGQKATLAAKEEARLAEELAAKKAELIKGRNIQKAAFTHVILEEDSVTDEMPEEDFKEYMAELEARSEVFSKEQDEIAAKVKAAEEKVAKLEAEAQERRNEEIRIASEEKALSEAPEIEQLQVWIDGLKAPSFVPQTDVGKDIAVKFLGFKDWAEKKLNK